MTLTLDMSPELQDRLREQAAQEGVTAEEYARRLLEDQLLNRRQMPEPGKASPEERQLRLSAWIESNRGLPALPEEAFHRGSFYGERG